MITITRTASAFNGAGLGLVTFDDLPLPPAKAAGVEAGDITPIITNIALQGDDVTTVPVIDCFLRRVGGVSTEQIKVRRITVETGFTLAGCRIPVPRDFATAVGVPWELVLITTGQGISMSWVISFRVGQSVVDA